MRLALRAIAWLSMVRILLATVGFPRIRARLESLAPRRREAESFPGAVRRAMSRASRTVPGSRCFPQAVTAFVLLRRGGHPAELTIGVAGGAAPRQPLDAHAWVRSGSLVVTGDHDGVDLSRFSEIARFGNRA